MEEKQPQGLIIEQEVIWGDMDAYGHVNNVQYLRYFETARIKYFDAILKGTNEWAAEGIPVVAKLSCDYKRPVVYPDTLYMRTYTKSMSVASMVMVSEMKSSHGGIAAIAECVIVFVDKEKGRPRPIHKTIRTAVEQLEEMVF